MMLGQAAKWLKIEATTRSPITHHYPMVFVPYIGAESLMVELVVPPGSQVVGRSVMQLDLPRGVLIVLVSRGEDSIVPNGATVLQAGDKLVVLANETDSADLADGVAK
jgi:potassium/hydrogen antiporter